MFSKIVQFSLKICLVRGTEINIAYAVHHKILTKNPRRYYWYFIDIFVVKEKETNLETYCDLANIGLQMIWTYMSTLRILTLVIFSSVYFWSHISCSGLHLTPFLRLILTLLAILQLCLCLHLVRPSCPATADPQNATLSSFFLYPFQ